MSKVIISLSAGPSDAMLFSLRAVARNVLASGIPGVAGVFGAAAIHRIRHSHTRSLTLPLFAKQSRTENLNEALARARAIYGAGLGLESLPLLTEIVKGTVGLRWEKNSEIEAALADIDTDITQAIQVNSSMIVDMKCAHYL